MVTPVDGLPEGVFQAKARGGEIACLHIAKHADTCQAAQDALVAEFLCQALGFIQPGRH
jgi:hypothetical protein